VSRDNSCHFFANSKNSISECECLGIPLHSRELIEEPEVVSRSILLMHL
jgi:hypothetical protein